MKGTTKGTKVKPSTSAKKEECGIWLDTTELKEKKQQKQITRPISKLLNPLAKNGGYGVAVALSFTQTKLNMPVTRQSTISSFFSPKPADPQTSTAHDEMYSPSCTKTRAEAKRKHGETLEPPLESDITFEVYQKNCDLDYEDISAKDSDDRKEQSFIHLMCGYESDEEPPGKRRAFGNSADHNVLDTQECSNKARSQSPQDIQTVAETETFFHGESQGLNPLMVRTASVKACRDVLQNSCLKELQGFKEKRVLKEQNTAIEERILTSRPVNANHKKAKAFGSTNMDQEHSWYKPKAYTNKLTGKENMHAASPIHNPPSSPLKRNLVSSPAKSRLKDKYTNSLKKSGSEESATEMVGDSHAMLFTQDSEGFCVIAHRDQHPRSPLKDHSNLSIQKDYRNSPSGKEDEESDLDAEMLFTQDSEGNMVIKH